MFILVLFRDIKESDGRCLNAMLDVLILSLILFWSTFLNANSQTDNNSPWTGNKCEMPFFISVNTDSSNHLIHPNFDMLDYSLLEKFI